MRFPQDAGYVTCVIVPVLNRLVGPIITQWALSASANFAWAGNSRLALPITTNSFKNRRLESGESKVKNNV